MPATASGSSWSGPALAAAAEAAHRRLRGEVRHGHVERRLHPAPGVLHRAVAADRPSPARAPLRRPARLLPRLDADDDAAARRQPSPTASAATSSTIGTSSMRCARSRWRCSIWSTATSCSRVRPIARAFEALLRRGGRQAGVQGDGRVAGAGARPGLRGRAGAGHRRRSRCRPVARSGDRCATASSPIPASVPDVAVELVPLSAYDELAAVHASSSRPPAVEVAA